MSPHKKKIWTINAFRDSPGYGGEQEDEPEQRPYAALPQQPSSSSFGDRQVHSAEEASQALASSSPPQVPTFVIASLPQSMTTARALLERVTKEFEPILQRRGYNVLSISELCCCGDGLDDAHEPINQQRGKENQFRPRRKRRRMSHNVWGYNQTTFVHGRANRHTIHLRLRHATNHAMFMSYEDVAGTLAHELAHCEHSAHNAAFYRLMNQLIDEHAQELTNQLNGYTPFGGTGLTTGGPTTGSTTTTGVGQKLGGRGKSLARVRHEQQAKLASLATAQQAALQQQADRVRRAAQRTVTQENKNNGSAATSGCCGGLDDDTGEILDIWTNRRTSSSNSSNAPPPPTVCQPCGSAAAPPPPRTTTNSQDAKKPAVKTKATSPSLKEPPRSDDAKPKAASSSASPCIDLTVDSSSSSETEETSTAGTQDKQKTNASSSNISGQQPQPSFASSASSWACRVCTFVHVDQPLALACSLCHSERRRPYE